MTYANTTSVSVEKTKAEIERLLTRYGASQFMTGWDKDDSAADLLGYVAVQLL